MSRTALVRLTLATALLGLGICFTTFLSTLSPSEKVYAELPRVALPKIAPGQFAYVADPRYPDTDLMFVRQLDGRLNAWYVMVRDGVHLLPDMHWWRPGHPCKNLGPQFRKGIITCADKSMPDWFEQRYVWTLDGKAKNRNVGDMEPVVGYEEFGDYVFGKKRG